MTGGTHLRSSRLDVFLVREGLASSRRQARELIARGLVIVNGRRIAKGRTVTAADRIEVEQPAAASLLPNPELLLEVLHTGQALLVVNKPGLLPCHPLRAGERNTLMNAVAARFGETADNEGKPLEGLLVHRLDNGTSGAVMVARSSADLARLRAALRAGEVERCYLALVTGVVDEELSLAAPIAHHPRNPRRMLALPAHPAPSLHARAATTIAKPIRHAGHFTLLEVRPKSGSRHQIRVHLAAAGHPIAGDTLYGGEAMPTMAPGRFFLHLAELKLPRLLAGAGSTALGKSGEGRALTVKAPLPDDLANTIALVAIP